MQSTLSLFNRYFFYQTKPVCETQVHTAKYLSIYLKCLHSAQKSVTKFFVFFFIEIMIKFELKDDACYRMWCNFPTLNINWEGSPCILEKMPAPVSLPIKKGKSRTMHMIDLKLNQFYSDQIQNFVFKTEAF